MPRAPLWVEEARVMIEELGARNGSTIGAADGVVLWVLDRVLEVVVDVAGSARVVVVGGWTGEADAASEVEAGSGRTVAVLLGPWLAVVSDGTVADAELSELLLGVGTSLLAVTVT